MGESAVPPATFGVKVTRRLLRLALKILDAADAAARRKAREES